MEAQQCRACRGRIEASWVRCPWCAIWLGRQCQRCDRWIPTDAEVCPWCLWEPGDALTSSALSISPARSMPVGINAPALDGRTPGRVDPDTAPRTA
jgi:RNA polymerase subunit RPABC4/transcription elongation factor Spt4